jgi:hypothetical protein
MGHMHTGETRFDATPPEWLKFGGQIAELANEWSGRGDIVAYVGKGAGQGIACACWVPSLAEMELNVKVAFGEGVTPEFIGNFKKRDSHFDHPAPAGAILHEAMHAKHTLFDLRKLADLKKENRFLGDLVEWFEETRIERRGVLRYPENRAFLRASALKLSLDDLNGEEDFDKRGIQSLSCLILLGLARVDAGVLDDDDVRPIKAVADKILGGPLVDKLRDVWVRAQAHSDDEDMEPLRKLAEEWIKLLEDAGHDTKPEEMPAEMMAMIAGALGELLEEMGEMAIEVEIDARSEAADQAEKEAGERAVEAQGKAAAEDKDMKDMASEVFGRGTRDIHGARSRSTLQEERPPKPAERIAAVKVAQLLEKAKYRDRVVVSRTSVLPPGRLNGRAAMQGAVERSRGQIQTAEPWKAKHRFHTEDPELKVGVMVDISGSMNPAMEPMGVTAWMLSEAVRRIQGRAAMVYYGNDVFPVLAPGQHLEKVRIYSAPDGTEKFDKAFKALNGKLDLLNSTGARLLVISSDMCYTEVEVQALRRWLKRCDQAGVAVVSIPFTTRSYVDDHTKGMNVRIVEGAMKPAEVATMIGQAAAEALEKVGSRG